MSLYTIPFDKTSIFSKLYLDYIGQSEDVREFYGSYPSVSEVVHAAKRRVFSKEHREILVETLLEQYKGIHLSTATKQNIEALRDSNTFTITTGHQISLAGGPLFFFYKILTAIQLAKKATQSQSLVKFVPVFWMATEDHDIAEVDHLYLFGKKYAFETKYKGMAGDLSTEHMDAFFNSLPEIPSFLREAYETSGTWAEATQRWVSALFAEEGLIVLNAQDAKLKNIFSPILSAEVFDQQGENAVIERSSLLEHKGYGRQVHPRPINLFYVQKNFRERIVAKEELWETVDGSYQWDKKSLEKEITSNPENFSPNVILRPVYQETILPNVAYVPGPGELAYWLQLKSVFQLYKAPFPILWPRHHVLLVPEGQWKKWEKFAFQIEEIFSPTQQLINRWIDRNDSQKEDTGWDQELILQLENQVAKAAGNVDKTLEPWAKAELVKVRGILDGIEKRLVKTKKEKYEKEWQQIPVLKEKWFPESQPQERVESWWTFSINYPNLKEVLVSQLAVEDFRFKLLVLDGKN